jgi:hypothetical protein
VLWAPLVARIDDGARGAANISARADFEMVRAGLRRHAVGGSVWELRIVTREPFRPVDFEIRGVVRERVRVARLDLAGVDGTIELRDLMMVGEMLRQGLVVRRLTVAGFGAEPRVSDVDGALRLDGEGISAAFSGASVERSRSRLLTVTWEPRLQQCGTPFRS